jgi:hypothetical protein
MKHPFVRGLALLPAVLPLWQILHYAVDVPYWDQLDDNLSGLHVKAHEGGLTFAALSHQHNEHRFLLPRLVFLALGFATRGNVVAEMLVAWGMVVATSLALRQLGQRTAPRAESGSAGQAWLDGRWFLQNLLIFSPTQWENWLCGMGLANMMPMLWIALALNVAAATGRDGIRTATIVVLGLLATYSSGTGLLCWGLAGGVLLWAPTWRGMVSRWRIAALLTVVTGVVVTLYFMGMAPPKHQGLTPQVSDPMAKLQYAMAFAGNPFTFALNYPPLALDTVMKAGKFIGAGMWLLLAGCAGRFVWLWRRGEDPDLCRRMVPWFAVAGFALGCTLTAAWSRAGIGGVQALSSRYASLAVYLPVALIWLVPGLWLRRRRTDPAEERHRRATVASVAGATLVIVLSLAVVPTALYMSAAWQAARRQTRAVAAFVKLMPDHPLVTATVFPDPAVAQRVLTGLERIGYLRFKLIASDQARRIATTTTESGGNIDQASNTGPGELLLTGWAILPRLGRPADLVALCAANEEGAPIIVDLVPVNTPRPDKAAELNNASLELCGWAVREPVDRFLQRHRPTIVTAWAFDGETGTLFPLAGAVNLGQ